MKRLTAYIQAILVSFVLLLAFPGLVHAATLSFDPLSNPYNKGCSFPVRIMLDTGGVETDGTDALINYDANVLSVNSSSITNGTIYNDYPGNDTSTPGKIAITGLAAIDQPYKSTSTSQGVFATINFSVRSDTTAQSTQVTFDFDRANTTKTTDSNVIKRDPQDDVLTQVNDATYTITTGSCGSQPTTTTPAVVTTGGGTVYLPGKGGGTVSTAKVPYASRSATCTDTTCQTGDSFSTFLLVIGGSALTILGILGVALL